jgi:4-aminobutyrate aminotransferase/(S)-3-amino-2-methylpropionate transaminase
MVEAIVKSEVKGAKGGERRKIPGEKATELFKLREEYVPKGVYYVAPIFVAQAKGAKVIDVDGNEYIDFTSGISVMNIGHTDDRVVAAIKEQADKHLHTCFHVMMYEPYVKLAQKLAEITPGDFPKQVMLVNSGAEAVENAIKIARRYTGRYGIIAFENAFHGRTAIGMGLTSQVKYYKYGFGPFDAGIQRFPYAYTYRAPFEITDDEYGKFCVKRIEDSFKTYTPAEETAAIIVEPFLGEGGYVAPPATFIRGLRELCDRYNILLIADEVQSGMGRTGKMWAIEHFGVVPDMLLAAKTLGGGLVLSAVVGKKEIMDSVDIGGLGGTFCGNPLSCVAALEVFKVIEEKRLLERATKLGMMAKQRLDKMKEKYSLIGDVRALGSSIAVELVTDQKTKEPASKETGEIQRKCLERGLIILTAGVSHNIFRLMYPLVIEEVDLEKGLDIFEDALKEISQKT